MPAMQITSWVRPGCCCLEGTKKAGDPLPLPALPLGCWALRFSKSEGSLRSGAACFCLAIVEGRWNFCTATERKRGKDDCDYNHNIVVYVKNLRDR